MLQSNGSFHENPDITMCCQNRTQANRGTRERHQQGRSKTLPWQSVGSVYVPGVPRNQCFAIALSQMKRAIPWKMKMNLEEDFVSIGEPFSRHARKDRDITNMKIFCDLFNKLLMTSIGLLIRLSLMNSLLLCFEERLGSWA